MRTARYAPNRKEPEAGQRLGQGCLTCRDPVGQRAAPRDRLRSVVRPTQTLRNHLVNRSRWSGIFPGAGPIAERLTSLIAPRLHHDQVERRSSGAQSRLQSRRNRLVEPVRAERETAMAWLSVTPSNASSTPLLSEIFWICRDLVDAPDKNRTCARGLGSHLRGVRHGASGGHEPELSRRHHGQRNSSARTSLSGVLPMLSAHSCSRYPSWPSVLNALPWPSMTTGPGASSSGSWTPACVV